MRTLTFFIVLVGAIFRISASDCTVPNLQKLYQDSELELAFMQSAQHLSCTTSQDQIFETISLLQDNLERFPGDTYYIQVELLKRDKQITEYVVHYLSILGKLRVEHDYFYNFEEAIIQLQELNKQADSKFALMASYELAQQQTGKESIYWYEKFLNSCAENCPEAFAAMALMSKGAQEVRLGEFGKAILSYQTALEKYAKASLNPEGVLEPWIRHGLASAYQASGQYEKAIEQLKIVQLADHYPAQEAVSHELEQMKQ